MIRRTFLGTVLATAMMAAFALPAAAQNEDWPQKEITIVVPVPPGSSADTTARAVAKVMERELGTTVVVENVVGGGGLTGFARVGQSKPDGYTIGLVNNGALLVMPHIQDVPVTVNDYAFLGGVAASYYGIAVAASSDIDTVEDLVKAGQERRLTYATSAPMNAVAMIQLANETGGNYQLVMTNSQPEAVAQAVGGHVDAVIQTPAEMVPLIDGGELTFIASASPRRWPKYPDTPTLEETGYDAVNLIPLGFAAPVQTPEPVLEKLRSAVAVAAQDDTIKETLERLNIIHQPLTAEEFLQSLKRNAPIVENSLEAAGMKRR